MAAPERPTITSRLQRRLEEDVADLYGGLLRKQQQQQQQLPLSPPPLARGAHARFLRSALGRLPAGFASLDASRCWIVFWALHGLALLGRDLGAVEEDEEEQQQEEEEQAPRPDDDADAGAGAGATSRPPQQQQQQPRLKQPRKKPLLSSSSLRLLRRSRPPQTEQQTGGSSGRSRSPPPPPPPEDDEDDDDDDDGSETDDNDDEEPTAPTPSQVAEFLAACQSPTGGFGGGPGQRPHLAPTYAAVAALVTLDSPSAWRVLDRPALRSFLLRCADEARRRGGAADGAGGGGGDLGCGFAMHEGGGEVDARSAYTALAAAELAALDVAELAARSNALGFFARCQTYEGGCGGEPGNEAHGGYAYCASAACAIVRRAAERAGDLATARAAARAVEPRAALRWAARRQAWVEGGFSGRANKLADGCYSFWVGALFPILREQMDWIEKDEGGGGGGGSEGPPPQEKEEEEEEQQEDKGARSRLDALLASGVPPLPRAVTEHRSRPPVEAAREAHALAKRRAGEAVAAALQGAGAAEDGGGDGDANATASALLLARASRAREAEDRAAADLRLAERSAAVIARDDDDDDDDAQADDAGPPPPLCDARALALWVLAACQPPSSGGGGGGVGVGGGLRDKPGKPPDFYHTCYCLSGLAAVAQHAGGGGGGLVVARTDALLNVEEGRAEAARAWFLSQGAAAAAAAE